MKKLDLDDLFDRNDFFHFRGEHDESVATVLNASLDPSATDGHGHALFGTGNSALGYAVQHNTEEGIEIAMKVHYRTGDNIPFSMDKHGVLQVDVPSGPQVFDPAHDVWSGNANRAAWNFDYSLAALGGKNLADYDVHLLIDTDPSEKVNYLDLHLTAVSARSHSGYLFETAASHVPVTGGSGGVLGKVEQDSFNFAFIKTLIDSNPSVPGIQPYTFGPGTFDVQLLVAEKDGHGHLGAAHDYVKSAAEAMHGEGLVVDLHMQVHVVDHPMI